MEWIKVSERLPEQGKMVIIRWFWEDGNSGVCWKDLSWIKEQEKHSKWYCVIEWLDESPSQPEDKLLEFLNDLEQWEADLISNNKLWWPYRETDALAGKLYEDFLKLQEKRNQLKSHITKKQ